MRTVDALTAPLSGTVLIEASAGTGKTYTLSNLYLRLVVEAARPVGEILVVTYTNAATAELKDRIRGRLRAALLAFRGEEAADDFLADFAAQRRAGGRVAADVRVLETALRSFDEAAIFTIHGFCQRMLLENAFESLSTFDAKLVADQRPLCREIVEDHWVRWLYDAPPALVAWVAKSSPIEHLEELVAKAVAHPDVPVLPARSDGDAAPRLDDALAERRAAWTEAASLWRRSRDGLLDVLTASGLKRGEYPPERIRSEWAPALDEFFGGDEEPAELYGKVAKLAAGSLKPKGGRPAPVHPFFDACQRLCDAWGAAQRELEEAALRFRLALIAWARAEVRRRNEAANAQSFDDLLHRLRDALRGPSGEALARRIRERFPAALVDEFQDTDPVQYEILRTVYREAAAPLVLIGDPKQAIYGFRGADVFAYLRARREAGDEPLTLETNHRSDPGLLTALNALFARARVPFLLDRIPYVPMRAARSGGGLVGPEGALAPLEILLLRRDGHAGARGAITKETGNAVVAERAAGEIARLLASGTLLDGRPLEPGDVAVLCRTNKQARLVQDALRALAIPSVRQGDDSVFDSDEAADLEQVLRAVAEPGDGSRLRCALATGVFGLDAAALHVLAEDEDAWDEWAGRFRSWHDLWVGRGFMAAFRRLLDECDVAPRLLAEEGGERSLTNLLHLAELLQAEALASHRGPLALVDWLARMRTDDEMRGLRGDAAEVRLESDAHAVQLTTIHRAKGLEYAVVYCPFLWDGGDLSEADKRCVRFHAEDAERTLCFDVGPKSDHAHDEHGKLARKESLAEGLRLVYVGLTRARHRCSVVWGGFSGAQASALAYLLHQPDGTPADASGEAIAQRVADRFPELGDAALAADLDALAAASDGAIAVRELAGETPPPYRPAGAAPRTLASRALSRPLPQAWRTSSFSALVAPGGRLGHRAEEGVDHDGIAASESAAAPHAAAAPGSAGGTVRLSDFPAGARAGQLVHDVFEHLDFTADDAAIAALVARRAKRHGFEDAAVAALAGAVRDVLETPLVDADGSLRLAAIPPARTVREMAFMLPVAQGRRDALDAARLAAALADLGGPAARAYAEHLSRVGFPELRGYLTGFVDLVFEHGGRWWIADYKSNHLGPFANDYRPDALRAEVLRRHYVLQYHLYTVALHAHLERRVLGYDYDRHFGGVLYLFVRGMSPAHPPGLGVFSDRPARALVEGLASWFRGQPDTRSVWTAPGARP